MRRDGKSRWKWVRTLGHSTHLDVLSEFIAGANWIQGTQTDDGPANPIWTLAQKHNLSTHFNDWFGSICMVHSYFVTLRVESHRLHTATFDSAGAVDYIDVFNDAEDAYSELTVVAGARVDRKLVDGTARTGYSLINSKARSAQAMASEYYQFDWEYAQTPEESSWIASSWVSFAAACSLERDLLRIPSSTAEHMAVDPASACS